MHKIAQISKQKAETQRVQANMQAAALDAANDAQSKDKRIHHLERKVNNKHHLRLRKISTDPHFRYKLCETSVLPRHESSQKPNNTSAV